MTLTKKYQPLFETLTLPNGTTLKNRFVLSPMITNSSTAEGHVSEEDIEYAKRRASSAPIQITGAAYIDPIGQLFEYGFSIDDDACIEGLKQLAKAMKKDGAKAIVQLTHAGRFAKIAIQKYGYVFGPSELHLHTPIKHTVYPLSIDDIQQVVQQYALATKRAIDAGFDGVEVSGAQRLLIQTFFSTFSNERVDAYGSQTIESRSRFGIEVLQAVQQVIDEHAPNHFILGYRGTPEETRGNEIGYSVEDFLYYMDQLLEVADIQYLAIASWGRNIYKQTVRLGNFQGSYVNAVVTNHMNSRIPVMATGGINSPDKALEALEHADMVGASTPFVTEPDFATKLEAGREDDIGLGFTKEEIADLAIPDRAFKDIVELMD